MTLERGVRNVAGNLTIDRTLFQIYEVEVEKQNVNMIKKVRLYTRNKNSKRNEQVI